MPLFDFHCKECNSDFELLVRGPTAYVCPECGSANVDKLLSRMAAPGKSKEKLARFRAKVAREGHLSNYAPSEPPRRK